MSAIDTTLVSKAWNMLNGATNITLLTHYNPDGDGVSACAALDRILTKLGKNVEAIYPTPLKTDIKRQPKKVLINTHSQHPDLIVMCDTANYERLYYPEVFKPIPSINIDHHASSSISATVNFVDANAPSTCDYLYKILHIIDPTLMDTYVAECLLYGILYDTQSFSIQSTGADVLRIAADLIDLGADYPGILGELAYKRSENEIKLWGKALADVQLNSKKNVAWLVVRQADLQGYGVSLAAIAGLENFIARLAAADATILFYEDEQGNSKASFRSKTIDVNKIAKEFGGGGHKFAAGLMLKEPIDDVVKKITVRFD